MGGAHSREELNTSDDEEYESGSNDSSNESDDERYEDSKDYVYEEERKSSGKKVKTPNSMEEVEAKLRELKLKYGGQQQPEVNVNPNLKNAVKLYVYVGGGMKQGKWMVAEKVTGYSFVRSGGEEDGDVSESEDGEGLCWVLRVGRKVRVRVSAVVQLKTFGEQKRVDFVANGVWAMKFFCLEDYKEFVGRFNECLFENTYGVEATDANKLKVYGKDFMGWAKPEEADEFMWEDAEDTFVEGLNLRTPVRGNDLREEFEEAADGDGIQSLALGALDNSFLVSDSGVQVVKNYAHGIQGKGVYVNFDKGNYTRGGCSLANGTPKKALLMRAEKNMLLMSPMTEAKPHSKGLHQLDIETGRIVTEWRFEKDGTDITMRDITNDGKGAQLDPSGSTFLGLDDNRLCRWDMRDKRGIVQDLITSSAPVLNWTQGHQFSRGTNFQCFATTGDGSIVVGSLDGKIRLYSNGSMRQAKTAFPGLGSPVTHVDVTFDGKWILGTTDTYLILMCSIFADKDGNTKTGFAARMGNRIAAPRLLKLNPLDSHLAGVNNKFRGAQFSWVTENGKQERHLVATVGKFSVIWNFQNVKNGSHDCYLNQEGLKSCYCYKIVLKDESIIDSRFMNDRHAVTDSPEAPLVVATSRTIRSFSISSKQISGTGSSIYLAQNSIYLGISRTCSCNYMRIQKEGKMAVRVDGSLYARPRLSPSHSTSLIGYSYGSPRVGKYSTLQPFLRAASRTVVQVQAQQRPTWLPGLDPPPYLDGE